MTTINTSSNAQTTTTTFTSALPPATTVPLNSFPPSFPSELILKIFEYLNPRDLVRACRLVCKQWCHVLVPDSVWKRLCELHFQLLATPKGVKNFQEAYEKRDTLHSNLTKGVFASLVLNQTNPIRAPLITADGKIFSGNYDHQIGVWDSNTGELISTLDSNDLIDALAYAKGRLFSNGLNGVIKAWNLNTYKCIATFEADQGAKLINALAYTDDDKLAVSVVFLVAKDLGIEVLDLTTGEYTLLGKLENAISFLSYADDKLISGDHSGFKVWDLKKNECVMTIRCQDPSLERDFAASFVYVEGMVISSHQNQKIKFWDLTTGQCIGTVQASGDKDCFLVYADGILFSCAATKVMIWNPKTRECTATLEMEPCEEIIGYVYADGKLIRIGEYYPEEGFKFIAMDFTASDTVIFEEIAGLFEKNDSISIKNAKERFSRMPPPIRLKIMGNRKNDSLTSKQWAQAIRSYLKKRGEEDQL